MNEPRFDRWARALSDPASRRQTILASVLGGLALLRGVHEALAKKKPKKHCGPCKKRKKGKCKPKLNGTPCGDGGACQGGKCEAPPPDPTCAETCDGCCSGSTCAPGDTDGACGEGGETCADCTPDSACCGGSCCDGCCFDGQCYPGNDIELCGSGGVACAECPIEEICTVDCICAPPTCGNGGPCVVFVTSVEGEGDFGGLAGGDEACQFYADEAGLSGTYMAWLSDDSGSPSTRFMRSPGPYMLVNETVIADNWTALISGSLQAPIDRDEAGDVIGGPPHFASNDVWTNTKSDGAMDESGADCEGWNSENAPGGIGDATATNAAWTEKDHLPCDIRAHLYCFQQS